MTNPQIQNSIIPVNEPSMADLINITKKEIGLNTNCHHVGIIQSFDPDKQVATVSIAYTKTNFVFDQDSGVYSPIEVSYPLLGDVPVVIIGGGTSAVTFPIKQGDECLVLFNDRDINNWFQSGQVGPVATPRFHSLSDGFALVGIHSLGKLLQNYSSTHATLYNGTTGVGVGSSQVKIYNQTNGSLGPNFQAFFTALTTFMNACTTSSTDPTLAAAATAFVTAISIPVAPSSLGPIQNIEGVLE